VKAPFQMLFIDRLAKVADDPIVQGADSPTALWVMIGMSARNVRYWHIASFRCAAEFARYRSIADIGQARTQSSSIYEYAP